jgi:putative hydrolase of the HAD superfamily
VLISGDLGVAKPAAAIFRQALARVGVAPAEALMIGDQPLADVAGARAVGIPAVLVRTRWHDPAEGRAPGAAIVSSLDEVTW